MYWAVGGVKLTDPIDVVPVDEMFESSEDKRIAARTIDIVRQTLQTADSRLTGFLNPTEQDVMRSILRRLPDVRYVMFGGYRGAERKRAIIIPSFFANEYLDFRIGALEIVPSSDGEVLSHGDYLGSILSLGLSRDRVGDIVVNGGRSQVFVDASIQQSVQGTLARVGRFRATVSVIDPERVEVAYENVEDIERTVASLRLDSVAAAGYSASRTKMTKEIRAGQVKLNWSLTTRPDVEVKTGDIISMRGRGRVEVQEVLGETRKGRVRIRLRKSL